MLSNLFIYLILSLGIAGTAVADSVSEKDSRIDTLMGAGTHNQYHQFLTELQHAVASGNKKAVAAMIDYPITVSVNSKKIDIKNKSTFIKKYDVVFNKHLTQIILNQKYEELFAKDTGIMVGEHGELWFSGICTTNDCKKFNIRIIAINN
ncbi:hypothetical protein [Pantoea sp. BAV 3049]|uniref:hypothetical protein n=1 Tax=Pantoea sp. BAV 3049 TaxID=2654188 RepID=UPI00131CDC5C|nr:hypothetical protein [Pantoea sp. BAV 3049]